MKRSLTYVLTVLALVVSLAVSCNKDRARVIPRSKLAKIYAEMFITDQWIQNTPNVRTIADTSLVYEPILQKYGFTSEDYQHSVNHYMNDPERFSRILRTTSDILDQKIKDLRVLAQLQAEAKEKAKKFNYGIDLAKLNFSPLPDGRPKNWSDTLKFEWDSLDRCYRTRKVPRLDTVYDGVRMYVRLDTWVTDSLAVDSLAVDSLAVKAFNKDSVLNAAKSLDLKIKPIETPTRKAPQQVSSINEMASKRMNQRKQLNPRAVKDSALIQMK